MGKEKMSTEGWKKFVFYSSYYGSHPEQGEGSVETVYFFHPSVDISQWENVEFSHGHCSQDENNSKFEEWLKSLPPEKFMEEF